MDDEALVAAVQSRPVLFDKGDRDYANRSFISRQWEEIATELDSEAETLRKRWGRLRDYFQRNHKNIKAFKTGSARRKFRKWYLYDALSFLIPYLGDRPTTSNITIKYEDNEETEHIESPVMPSSPFSGTDSVQDILSQHVNAEQQQQQQQEQQHQEEEEEQQQQHYQYRGSKFQGKRPKFIKSLKHVSNNVLKKRDDEDEMYCLSLVSKMKTLDPITKLECQAEMNSVLVKYMKMNTFSPAPPAPFQPLSYTTMIPVAISPSTAATPVNLNCYAHYATMQL